MTCSAGSPVRKASSPRPIASAKLVAPPRHDRRRCGPGRARRPRRRAPGRRPPRSARAARRARRPRTSARRSRSCARCDRPNGSACSKPERLADQRVVSHLGVGVERQVVAGERHVGVEERPQAPLIDGDRRGWKSQNSPWWAITSWAPARPPARRDRGGRRRPWPRRHLLRARHLQPVRAVVGEAEVSSSSSR